MAATRRIELSTEKEAVEYVFAALDAYIAQQGERQRNPDGAHRAERTANSRDAQAKLEKYQGLQNPVIGRMTTADGFDLIVGDEEIHDQDNKTITCSWKSDFGATYYEATPTDPMGLTLRRQFKLDDRTLLDYEDLFDYRKGRPISPEPTTSADPTDGSLPSGAVKSPDAAEALTPAISETSPKVSDFLLDALRKRRSGSMAQIVATIQAEQSRVLRTDPNTLLIIQGSPGTGKTVVGLHRASWILFNELRRTEVRALTNEEPMLIVGPNEAFIQYIKDVLPRLGDLHVAHRSITSFGKEVDASLIEIPHTRKLKGEARMAGLLERGLRQRIVVPSGGLQLDEDGNDVIPEEDLKELVDQLSNSSYLGDRTSFVSTLTRRFANGDPDRANRIERLAGRVWPSFTAEEFLAGFFGSGTQLLLAANGNFTTDELLALRRERPGRRTALQWSLDDRPLLDHVNALLSGPQPQYRHIIVDEAQDLSPMQLMLLSRRSTTGAFTILGDVAQSTGPWSRGDWNDARQLLQTKLPTKLLTLEVGYRVPVEIMEFANQLLPVIAPDLEFPMAIRSEGVQPKVLLRAATAEQHPIDDDDGILIAEEISNLIDEGFNVGVIALQEDLLAIQRVLTSLGWKWGTVGDETGLHSTIVTLTPQEAKGLEFDATVVVNTGAIARSGHDGLRLLYVALTRATQRLTVVLNADGTLVPSDLVDAARAAHPLPSTRSALTHTALNGIDAAVLDLARFIQTNVDEGISILAFDQLVRVALRLGKPELLAATEPLGLLEENSRLGEDAELLQLNEGWLLHFENYPPAAQEAFKDGAFARLQGGEAEFHVPSHQLIAAIEQKPHLTSSVEAILGRTTKVSYVALPSETEE